MLVHGFSLNEEEISDNLDRGFLMATDLAEHLVERGVPFREAHRQVGQLVAYCVDNSIGLSELSLEQIREFLPASQIDSTDFFSPRGALVRRVHRGSSGFSSIEFQLQTWRSWLKQKASSERGN
jgi:argininosuccinate lyase